MKATCDPRKNKSGGAQDAAAQRKKKAATAPKGRGQQKRGSADHNTKPRYAKPMKNRRTDYNENMKF